MLVALGAQIFSQSEQVFSYAAFVSNVGFSFSPTQRSNKMCPRKFNAISQLRQRSAGHPSGSAGARTTRAGDQHRLLQHCPNSVTNTRKGMFRKGITSQASPQKVSSQQASYQQASPQKVFCQTALRQAALEELHPCFLSEAPEVIAKALAEKNSC